MKQKFLSIHFFLIIIVFFIVTLQKGESQENTDCPKPFMRLSSNVCYYFSAVGDTVNWFVAEERCRCLGATLACPHKKEAFDILHNYMRENFERKFWLGGSDLAEEGRWVWMSDMKEISYDSFWADGQPDNDQGIQNCLMMASGSKSLGWTDEVCHTKSGFVCERTNRICEGNHVDSVPGDPMEDPNPSADSETPSWRQLEDGVRSGPNIQIGNRGNYLRLVPEGCCPPKFVRLLNGLCHFFSKKLKLTWQAAKEFCLLMDSILAEPHTPEEELALRSYQANFEAQVHWLGAKNSRGLWAWDKDGDVISDETFKEKTGQKTYIKIYGRGLCLSTSSKADFIWSSNNCRYRLPFVCTPVDIY